MAQRKDNKKGGIWGTMAVASAGIALTWAAFELALAPILKPGRDALDRSLDSKVDDDEAVVKVEEVADEAKVKEKEKEVLLEDAGDEQ